MSRAIYAYEIELELTDERGGKEIIIRQERAYSVTDAVTQALYAVDLAGDEGVEDPPRRAAARRYP